MLCYLIKIQGGKLATYYMVNSSKTFYQFLSHLILYYNIIIGQ